MFTKISVLKEIFPVFKRLKKLQILKPALKFVIVTNNFADKYFDCGKEGDILIFWKDFLRFKAFIIEQKWNKNNKL